MRLVSALALALALAAAPARAQESTIVFTALPVLDVPAVPDLGGATVGRTADDARAFLQNPSALALAPSGAAVAGTPNSAWFGESRYEVGAGTWNARLGRFAVGVGVAQGSMNAEARTLADGTPFDPTDRFRAVGASVGTTGAVRVSLGATARYITSTDAPVYDGTNFSVGRLRGVTADVGALATADIAALVGRPRLGVLAPALDVSLGYAQTHIGGQVKYSGFSAQALPRTGALGWSIRTGLDLPLASRSVRLVEAEAAFQGERYLVHETDDVTSYDALVSGMGMADALTGSATPETTGRRGLRLGLAETLSLSWGRFEGGGYRRAETRSVEVGTAGLFALAASRLAPGPLARTLAQVDLRLGRTTVFAGSADASTRTTLRLVVGR